MSELQRILTIIPAKPKAELEVKPWSCRREYGIAKPPGRRTR